MFKKGFNQIKNFIKDGGANVQGSAIVTGQKVLKSYMDDENFPFLVSFPRTGSHWLRMIIELYFERPLLTRTFFFPDKKDYLLLHTHDMDLDVRRENVIYLYRDPVDTVFSQLMYCKEDTTDRQGVVRWSDHYGRHLDKWLHDNGFVRKLTVLKYERLRDDPVLEFKKITAHFGVEFNEDKLRRALESSTKEKLKDKTMHDRQVVNLKEDYTRKRKSFRVESESLVWESLLSGREFLREDF